MQVFMKPRGNGVLDGSFNRVGRESRAHPLSEARRASPIIPWAAAQLPHSCLRNHTAHRCLPEGRLLPLLAVWMRLRTFRHRGIGGCQRNCDENELGDPAHTTIRAIRLPFTCPWLAVHC